MDEQSLTMDQDVDKTRSVTTSGKQRAVPKGRVQRFGKFARLAGGVAGNMLARGAAQLATGKRPRVRNLLLTPKNAMRLTTQLAEMRGAAMKLGQILSMDTGDLLPQELADILATLRNAGYAMPDAQLQEVLADGLGPTFEKKLKGFESQPFAAASIGQVHRLSTRRACCGAQSTVPWR